MNVPKVLFLIQVRMASERLPGKAMLHITGKPMIERLLDRFEPVLDMGELVIATTEGEEESHLVAVAEKYGIPCYRGDKNDSVSRFLGAAEKFDGEILVRITGDNPLTDPFLTRDLIRLLSDNNLDYAASKGLPLGIGSEVFTLDSIKRVKKGTNEPIHRESITSFMYSHPDTFAIEYIDFQNDTTLGGRASYRLTVDTESDLVLMNRIFSSLGNDPSLHEVLNLLDSCPDLRAINSNVVQRTI